MKTILFVSYEYQIISDDENLLFDDVNNEFDRGYRTMYPISNEDAIYFIASNEYSLIINGCLVF